MRNVGGSDKLGIHIHIRRTRAAMTLFASFSDEEDEKAAVLFSGALGAGHRES